MTYASFDGILIRTMKEEDIDVIHKENLSHGWCSDINTYGQYFNQQNNETLFVFVAEYDGEFAGYTTLRPQALAGPFSNQGIPELADFNVFIPYRRRGIGSKILDVAEDFTKNFSAIISLGVGLHSGYGSAQRLYIKRGYIPDGTGVWYENRQLDQYTDCRNDDELVLYLSKQL